MFDLQAELYNKIIILRLTGDILLADVVEFNQQMENHIAAPDIAQVVVDLKAEVEKIREQVQNIE